MDNEIQTITGNMQLPPLPASDPESMARNRFHGFYGQGSRDYWKDAEINLNKIQDFTPCQHVFKQQGHKVICLMCHAGFIGAGISAQDGKLLMNNQEAVF